MLNSAEEFAGVQQYILTIAQELKTQNITPIIWLNKNPVFEEKLKTNKIEHYVYLDSILSVKNILKLIKIINENDIHIVHSNLGGAAIVGALIRLIPKVKKLVYTQHFINPASTQGGLIERLVSRYVFKLILFNYSTVVAISSDVKKGILERKEVPERKISLIYNGIVGVDLNEKMKKLEVPDVLLVSRLEAEKGIDKILPVFWKLLQNGYEFTVTIVGSGSKENMLKKIVASLAIGDYVRFIGKVSDVRPFYSSASIFVHAANGEPFGLVLIEAMSAKLPVIAFNKGGPIDIVEHKKTGFLVENYDAFGVCLEQLFKDKKLVEEMGVAGYERYQKMFTVEIMMKQLMEIYNGAEA